MSAVDPANGAEMAQVQRMAQLMPPLCSLCSAAADAREEATEHTKTKIFNTKALRLKGTERNVVISNAKARGGKEAKGILRWVCAVILEPFVSGSKASLIINLRCRRLKPNTVGISSPS